MLGRDGIYKLKKGPSSTKSVYGVYCEGSPRRGSRAHYVTWVNSDCGPEQNLYSCIFGTQVDRKRRANCPLAGVNKQWVHEEGSTYVVNLWAHATAMREIYDAYRAGTDGVFGWYKLWKANR